jgi:ATP-dependent Clp protease protease subunit
MAQVESIYIRFFGGIDIATLTKLTQLVEEQLRNGVDRFVLLMSSPGGNVFAGLTGYSYLKGIPAEVMTHNCGSVDSIAVVLYRAGSRRLCVPHARFLLHGISYDITKPARFGEKTLDEHAKSLRMDRENMAGVIADSTGRPVAEIERDILEGTVLNSEQAVEYGLVDEIRSDLFEKGAEIFEIA